jgi:Carboxypeptidase regulatory-like domain/Domain of unknown function (DUF3244)
MNRLSPAALAIASVLAFSTMAAAAPWTASVTGRVVNVQSLVPVSGATIRIYTENGFAVQDKAVTDAQGRFTVGGLRGGQYRLEFERKGYQRTVLAGLYVRPSEKYIEAAPIAMYPNGVELPRVIGSNPCGSAFVTGQTADVYIICSGE